MIATRHSLDDARVVHKEALSLKNAGHEVILVLSCNDEFEYIDNNNRVIAYGKYPNGECRYKGLKIFGFPKRTGLLGKWQTYKILSFFLAELKADIYHAHEPDLSLGIALRAKNFLKTKGIKSYVIHDMHEYPPGQAYDKAKGVFKNIMRYIKILLDYYFVKNIDSIITANTIVRGYVLTLSYRKSIDVIYNAPILKLSPQLSPSVWDKNSKLMICHEGSLPFNRGLKELIGLVKEYKNKIKLRIIGDVFGSEREWFEKEVKKHQLEKSIDVTGWLPYEQVGDALRGCHVGLILFDDIMNNRLAGPPNKLFNYMNAGLPVVSVDFPEMHHIINEENCGILIKGQVKNSLKSTINTLLNLEPKHLLLMGINGQRAIRDRYSWEIMEKRLLNVYNNIGSHTNY